MSKGQRFVPREFMAIIQPYLDAGLCTIENGGKHAILRHKDGHKRPIPGSPSDVRALMNFKSQVRRFIEGESSTGDRCKHVRK